MSRLKPSPTKIHELPYKLRSLCGLEHQFHGKLELPRVLRALNYIEVRVSKDTAGEIQIRVVERIENIEPELEFQVLGQGALFLDR